MNDDIDERLAASMKLGGVSSSDWQAYTWKNELQEQSNRIAQHLNEALSESETDHNPYHMLERSIGIASVCMRRLIECKLVTDKFCETNLEIHTVYVKRNVRWREPFASRMASEIFNNYDLTARHSQRRLPKFISDKMLHARVIGVISESAYLPDGLLIASDTQRKASLFHLTCAELVAVFDAFLVDRVSISSDGYVDVDGNFSGTENVFSIRK